VISGAIHKKEIKVFGKRYDMEEMRMPKVSIIMPSKNVASYIEKCLQSVLNQTLKDIEVLCIDAHSTDGTREIIRKYMEKDSRIKLFNDDMGSSGYADNLGLENAQGEYVAIVETDDYIKDVMMEVLYNQAKKYDLDYIRADLSVFIEPDQELISFDHIQSLDSLNIYDQIIKPSDYPELLVLDGYMWKGIYKKKFIDDYKIRLNETKGAAYQDMGFFHQILYFAQRAMYIKESFYQYRRDNEYASVYSCNGLNMMLVEYGSIEKLNEKYKTKVEPFLSFYYYKMFLQFRVYMEKTVISLEYSKVEEIIEKYKELFMKGLNDGYISQEVFGPDLIDLNMFLEDSEYYYKSSKVKLEAINALYVNVLKDIKKKNEVVIVCCGDKGSNLYSLLRNNGCRNIVGVCDNDERKWNKKFFDMTIQPLEELVCSHPNAFYIIANDKYHFKLKRLLIDKSIDQSNTYIYNLGLNPYFCTSHII
jgi:glycosyltransferase involved in cell wall biosynthesis